MRLNCSEINIVEMYHLPLRSHLSLDLLRIAELLPPTFVALFT